MSHMKKEHNNGSDIHVISRDAHDFPHSEHLDTPSFLQSLDLATPTGGSGLLFEPFSLEVDGQLHSENLDAPASGQELQDSFSLSSLTDFVHHEDEISKGHDDHPHQTHSGALTKMDHQLPALLLLSEPVVPPNIHLLNRKSMPDFLRGNPGMSHRPQPLLLTAKRKKEPQAPKARPAFVMKIWLMVNDPKNNDYIRWNDDGETFQVVNREEFMKNILPQYFKHNNFASFVRQLNMYGWHKIQDINSGTLKDDKNQEEVLKFKNPSFIRGREDLLDNIVRNKTGATDDFLDFNLLNLQYVINEIDLIKMNQLAIMEDMRRMCKDNQILWSESFTARDRYQKQAHTLDKIMKFLAAVYGNSVGKIFEVEDTDFGNQQVSTYNNTNNNINGTSGLDFGSPTPAPAPASKPRLMLMDQAYRKPNTSSGKSPTMASTGFGSVEEITRNTPGLNDSPTNPANATKIYQQIMNPESAGASSPSQFFPELNHSYFNANQRHEETSQVAHQHEEQLLGLEENIAKQGHALLQVQDWIQAFTNRQQEQQHQRQLNQNGQKGGLAGDPSLDDFDVDEFLNNNSLPVSYQDPPSDADSPESPSDTRKRVIAEIEDDNAHLHTKKRKG